MGHASGGKAPRPRGPAADNRGNRLRKLWAKGECLKLLVDDLRVQQVFGEWLQMYERFRDDPPESALAAGVDRTAAAFDRASIARLSDVLHQAGVPWDWPAPMLVTIAFPAMLANLQRSSPDDRVHGWVAEIRVVGIPRGQESPHDGAAIEQYVRWWYRNEIKQPSDSKKSLAKEYAIRVHRTNDCRRAVQKGIKDAKILLDGKISHWK
jgi:hypothetical protein